MTLFWAKCTHTGPSLQGIKALTWATSHKIQSRVGRADPRVQVWSQRNSEAEGLDGAVGRCAGTQERRNKVKPV